MGLPAATAAAPPPLVEWDWSAASNSTLSVGGSPLLLSQGTLLWASAERACRAASSAAPPVASTSTFYALPALMPADHAARLVERLRPARFDLRADSVDNLPAHEFYILTSGEPARSATPPLAAEEEEEARLRARLARELAPSLARLRAAANAQFGSICGGGCRPCTALVRRYRAAERRSHPEHVDAEAAVTAVVGLTSAREDFEGGLFVSDTARRLFVPLRAGDALLHSADLFHGVHVVGGGERWSLVVWFRTCDKCSMHGADGWFAARAARGEPIAQYLLGRRLAQEHSGGVAAGALGGRSVQQTRERRSRAAQWLHAAASAGFAPAMHMLGRASLGRGDVRQAVAWLRRSVECFSYETDFGRPPIAMRAAHGDPPVHLPSNRSLLLVHLPSNHSLLLVHLLSNRSLLLVHLPSNRSLLLVHLPSNRSLLLVLLTSNHSLLLVHLLTSNRSLLLVHLLSNRSLLLVHLPSNRSLLLVHLPSKRSLLLVLLTSNHSLLLVHLLTSNRSLLLVHLLSNRSLLLVHLPSNRSLLLVHLPSNRSLLLVLLTSNHSLLLVHLLTSNRSLLLVHLLSNRSLLLVHLPSNRSLLLVHLPSNRSLLLVLLTSNHSLLLVHLLTSNRSLLLVHLLSNRSLLLVHLPSNHSLLLVLLTSNHSLLLVHLTSNHSLLVHLPSNHFLLLVHLTSNHFLLLVHLPSNHFLLLVHLTSNHFLLLVLLPSNHFLLLVLLPSNHFLLLVHLTSNHSLLLVLLPSNHSLLLVHLPSHHSLSIPPLPSRPHSIQPLPSSPRPPYIPALPSRRKPSISPHLLLVHLPSHHSLAPPAGRRRARCRPSDLARILLKCAEFGWPRPYDQLDGSVLTDGDQQAQGLQLLRRAAVAGHRVAAKALGEAYADGRWGVSPDPRLAEGWLACANEADMEGHACSDMASECHAAANAPPLMISIEPTAATSTESSSAHRVTG
ncbi:hypothetical protein AB1Y20_020861 [Prymnesium parvum]|uniref:Fe2OG dioxygenase domain-containing protein n=1 Tax=Prymnesium parvum TaxID=97485 RepID=A0AB34JWH6_PRYPA